MAFVSIVAISIDSHAQQPMADLVVKVKASVVSIVTFDKNGQRLMLGSGFCVAPHQIITNKHVIEKSAHIEIVLESGASFPVDEIVGVDEDGDLALLRSGSLPQSVKSLAISKITPRVGDKIVVIGNPLGLEGTVSDGIVSAFRDVKGIGKLLQITAPISHGSSGSPVVNIWGEVVGVATANLEGGQNLNFAISSERLLSLWPSVMTASSVNPQKSLSSTTEGLILTADQSLSKGIGAFRSGNFDEAISYLNSAIKLDPKLAGAYHYLGLSLAGQKRFRESIIPFQTAIKLYSDNPPNLAVSIYSLGIVYFSLGEHSEAFKQYDSLKVIDPEKAKELRLRLTNLSGIWTTSYSQTYEIVDDGTTIQVKRYYKDDRRVRYEASWNGDIALGYIFSEFDKSRFVFKAVDFNHIWFRSYGGLNLKDTPEKVLREAKKQIEKEPTEIWTRM